MFIFKIIMGLLSAQIAKSMGEHPAMGLIIGAFFGHFLDMLLSQKIHEWLYKRRYIAKLKSQANADFLYCLFTLAAKVCSSDNVICSKEKNKIEEVINDRLKLNKKDKKISLQHFKQGAQQNITEQALASKIVELCKHTPQMLENTIFLLREIAECDGPMNKAEFRILFTLASVFGFDPEKSTLMIQGKGQGTNSSNSNTSEETKSNNIKPPEDNLSLKLKVLGCTKSDSNEKIRQRYRELVAKFHPDKIQSKELPQDFVDFAKDKFTEIQLAYEEVKKVKGF